MKLGRTLRTASVVGRERLATAGTSVGEELEEKKERAAA
jgi:hypothetical protein